MRYTDTTNATRKSKEIRDEKRRLYYLHPKLCKQCQEIVIPYTERIRQNFCSRKCSSIYNNNILYGEKIPRYCKNCGNLLSSRTIGDFCIKCKMIINTKKAIKNGTPMTPSRLRKYLKQVRGNICDKCKLKIWMNQPIPLDVHHIDGHWENNDLNNLQLLCKNCHALTDTYGSKNLGNGRPFTKKCKSTNIIATNSTNAIALVV